MIECLTSNNMEKEFAKVNKACPVDSPTCNPRVPNCNPKSPTCGPRVPYKPV